MSLRASVTINRRGLTLKVVGDKTKAEVLPEVTSMLAGFAYEQLRFNAPVKTGALRDSVTVTVMGLKAVVRPTAEYAGYVERGTRAHIIRVRNRRALHWREGSQSRFAKSVNHPGAKAHEYIRQTKLEIKDQTQRIFQQVWRDNLG